MADIVSWPWPKFISTENKVFYVSLDTNSELVLSEIFYTTENYWAIVPVLNLGSAETVEYVSIADFDTFYIICLYGLDEYGVPLRKMFVRDVTQALAYEFDSFTQPIDLVCGCCLNNRGQFIGGNLLVDPAHQWQALDSRSLIWSGIGKYEFNPQTDITAGAGYLTLPYPFTAQIQIVKLLRLGNGFVSYSNGGKILHESTAVNTVVTYSQKPLPGLGIVSGNHVDGNEFIHGFIDLRGEFWLLEPGPKLTRRGYSEFILPILNYTSENADTRTIVSYSQHQNAFYISNGNTCLLINEFGAAHCHQMVSSVIQTFDGNFATFSDNENILAYITTDSLDYGSRGIKSVESMLCNVSTNSSTVTVKCAVDWASKKGVDFRRSGLKSANYGGESAIHIAAVDFRLHVNFSAYTNAELFEILANIKFSDQRFKRGTVPAQFSA